MCGRFGLFSNPDVLKDQFELPELPGISPRYNIAPTESSAVVRQEEHSRDLEELRWGLVPFWSDGPDELDYDFINARAETAAESGAFRRSFYRRRCLVPADGFYEWKQTGNGKQPYWIYPTRERMFGFAGLWDRWEDEETDRVIESFTILTCDANQVLEPVHDRMPVILQPEEYGTWIDPDRSDREALESLLDPFDEEGLDMHPVSTSVNHPGHDRPECVEPISD